MKKVSHFELILLDIKINRLFPTNKLTCKFRRLFHRPEYKSVDIPSICKQAFHCEPHNSRQNCSDDQHKDLYCLKEYFFE